MLNDEANKWTMLLIRAKDNSELTFKDKLKETNYKLGYFC